MSEPVKKLQWGYTGMIPFSETAEKLGLHAYVQIENYQFMQKRADNLESENARLKAEVEALKLGSLLTAVDVLQFINLKAEVERLTALIESNLNSSKVAMGKADAVLHERDSLKAEVERLRKARDAMQDAVETYFELMPMLVNEVRAKAMLKGRKAIKDWNAAKEGKQP